HARVPLGTVPVAPVPLQLAQPHGDLIQRRLDLLQAHDVGLFALDPFLQLRLTSSDTVDIPRRDLHLPHRLYVPRAFNLRYLTSSGGRKRHESSSSVDCRSHGDARIALGGVGPAADAAYRRQWTRS